MQCIVDKGLDVTSKNQQQTTLDVVDDVIGDELAVKASPAYCSSIDASKNTAWEKHITSLSHNSGGLPDIAKHTGSISAATHSSSGKSESDCSPTETNDGAMPKFQPVTCNVGLSQVVDSQSVAFQLSPFPSSSSSTSSSSLAEDRNVESEQVIPCIVRNPSGDNVPQPKSNVSDSVEAAEGTVSQATVAGLSALLAVKDKDFKELDKDMKNLQLINKQLLEEKSILVLENQWLQKETKKAREEKMKDECGAEHFAFNPIAPTVLQRQIEDLKSHIRDLQEANETVVNELSKADEEISELKGEIARLRVPDELRDARQERDYCKDKICRLHSDSPQLTGKDNTSDLLEEIQHLRIESRKLRENNHQLDEENHQMKEELWDFRQHQEWFFNANHKEKKQNLEINKKGGVVRLAQKVPLCKKQVVILMKEPLQELKRIAPSSKCRIEFATLEEKNGRLKSSQKVTSASFDQTIQTWDVKDKERAENCVSPISLDSDNTEALIASCNNGIFSQSSHSKINNFKDHLLDLDGLSDEDVPSLREINGDSLKHCSRPTPRKSSQAVIWKTFNRNNHLMRPALCKAVLPRRPFAPRSVADLKIGHLVKFSRPAGKISNGAVKYLGPLPGRQQAYIGVELEGNERGKHDGIFEGVRYFICKSNKGVFVNFSKVIMAWE